MALIHTRMNISEIELYYDGDQFVTKDTAGRAVDEDAADNILEFALKYPRSGVAVVSTTKIMDLPSRTKVTPDAESFWSSGIFKEDIDGETIFSMSVSDKDMQGKFTNFLRRICCSMFGTLVSGKLGAITNVFQGAVLGDLQGRMADGIRGSQEDNTITPLCASRDIYLDFNAKGLAAAYYIDDKHNKVSVLLTAGSKAAFAIDLLASCDLADKRAGQNRGGYDARTRRWVRESAAGSSVVFKKNDTLGRAVIQVQVTG